MTRGGGGAGERASMFAAALDVAPHAILISNGHAVLFANAEARRVLKYPEGVSLEGRLVSEIVHPDNLETSRMREEILRATATTLHGLPVKLRALDGSVISLVVAGTPVEFDGQRVFMFTSEH